MDKEGMPPSRPEAKPVLPENLSTEGDLQQLFEAIATRYPEYDLSPDEMTASLRGYLQLNVGWGGSIKLRPRYSQLELLDNEQIQFEIAVERPGKTVGEYRMVLAMVPMMHNRTQSLGCEWAFFSINKKKPEVSAKKQAVGETDRKIGRVKGRKERRNQSVAPEPEQPKQDRSSPIRPAKPPAETVPQPRKSGEETFDEIMARYADLLSKYDSGTPAPRPTIPPTQAKQLAPPVEAPASPVIKEETKKELPPPPQITEPVMVKKSTPVARQIEQQEVAPERRDAATLAQGRRKLREMLSTYFKQPSTTVEREVRQTIADSGLSPAECAVLFDERLVATLPPALSPEKAAAVIAGLNDVQLNQNRSVLSSWQRLADDMKIATHSQTWSHLTVLLELFDEQLHKRGYT